MRASSFQTAQFQSDKLRTDEIGRRLRDRRTQIAECAEPAASRGIPQGLHEAKPDHVRCAPHDFYLLSSWLAADDKGGHVRDVLCIKNLYSSAGLGNISHRAVDA